MGSEKAVPQVARIRVELIIGATSCCNWRSTSDGVMAMTDAAAGHVQKDRGNDRRVLQKKSVTQFVQFAASQSGGEVM